MHYLDNKLLKCRGMFRITLFPLSVMHCPYFKLLVFDSIQCIANAYKNTKNIISSCKLKSIRCTVSVTLNFTVLSSSNNCRGGDRS